jgi:hypothetical protein
MWRRHLRLHRRNANGPRRGDRDRVSWGAQPPGRSQAPARQAEPRLHQRRAPKAGRARYETSGAVRTAAGAVRRRRSCRDRSHKGRRQQPIGGIATPRLRAPACRSLARGKRRPPSGRACKAHPSLRRDRIATPVSAAHTRFCHDESGPYCSSGEDMDEDEMPHRQREHRPRQRNVKDGPALEQRLHGVLHVDMTLLGAKLRDAR